MTRQISTPCSNGTLLKPSPATASPQSGTRLATETTLPTHRLVVRHDRGWIMEAAVLLIPRSYAQTGSFITQSPSQETLETSTTSKARSVVPSEQRLALKQFSSKQISSARPVFRFRKIASTNTQTNRSLSASLMLIADQSMSMTLDSPTKTKSCQLRSKSSWSHCPKEPITSPSVAHSGKRSHSA